MHLYLYVQIHISTMANANTTSAPSFAFTGMANESQCHISLFLRREKAVPVD